MYVCIMIIFSCNSCFCFHTVWQVDEFKKCGASQVLCLYVGEMEEGRKWAESIKLPFEKVGIVCIELVYCVRGWVLLSVSTSLWQLSSYKKG